MYTNLSLLVVDDNLINHRVVKLSLRGFIDHVDTAANGQEAVDKFKNKHYDVVLMDTMMPVMNGCQATASIRSYEREKGAGNKSLIISLTASDSEESVKACLESEADAYLFKPFNKEQFFKILEEKL